MSGQPFATGRCLCGAVQFTISAEPLGTGQCHCKDCQPERGPYKTDGPHVPDVFSLRPIKRCCDKKNCDD